MNKLKIVFFGSSYFSLSILEYIYKFKEIDILCIITKNNDKSNKKNYINIIKLFSIKNNIKILQPKILNNNISKIINELYPDLILIISYGKLIPNNIIKIPKFGCINLHCSILPKWKGPFPIYWSILSGDKESGITIIKINDEFDSGNIIYQKKVKITSKETYISLENKLIEISNKCIIDILFKLNNKIKIYEKKQINNKNYEYARKIKKEDKKINWNLSSEHINRHIRANILHGSYFYYKNKNIKVLESNILTNEKNNYKIGKILYIYRDSIGVNTNKGILEINKIQFENSNIININDYINSNNFFFKIGDLLN